MSAGLCRGIAARRLRAAIESRRRQASRPSFRTGRRAWPRVAFEYRPSGVPDPRIDDPVHQIREKVEPDDEDSVDESHRHDHGRVTISNRVDQQIANSRNAKICSVITAPAKTLGTPSAMRVTTGIRLFRTTWRMMTADERSPFARAVRT